MSCRATGCDGREWMARKFCDRHWKRLPVGLQIQIRKALEWNRRASKDDQRDLQPLFDQAQAIISAREADDGNNATIEVFRTHMATMYGAIVSIRTLDFIAIRDQLASSSEELLAANPELHAERQPRIARDLALLDYFAGVRTQLGEIIEAYPVPTPPLPAEVDA